MLRTGYFTVERVRAATSEDIIRGAKATVLEARQNSRDEVRQVADACEAVSARRQAGMIVAFDLARNPAHPGPRDGRVSLAIREAALARGVLLRPLHDTVYWMPPLNIDADALSLLARVTAECIDEVMNASGT